MTALAGYLASVNVSTGTSTATTNEAMTDNGDHKTFYVTSNAHKFLDPTVTPVVQEELDEIQTVTITGSPTGGTFTLTFGGNTTTGIAYNASAATVQAALVALASIGASNATVTGANGGPWTVEFTAGKGFAAQALMTKNASGLTGGTSPDVAIAEAQAGMGWTTIAATTYALQYCGGVVTLNTAALSSGVGVRLSTANYLVTSVAGQAKSIDIQTQVAIADVSTFAGGVWKQKLVLLGEATIKLSQWWFDTFYMTNLTNLFVIVAYSGRNANAQIAAYAYLKTNGLKIDVKAPTEQSLDFESHGAIFSINA